MKKTLLTLAALIAAFCTVQAKPSVAINIPSGKYQYKAGEEVTFKADVLCDDKEELAGNLDVILSNDGGTEFKKVTLDLAKDKTVTISGTMKEPGILRCTVVGYINKELIKTLQLAGFDTDKILPYTKKPDDFDQFWTDAIVKCNSMEEAPQITEMAIKHNNCKVFKAVFPTQAGPVYALMTIPESNDPAKKFPVIIYVPASGVGIHGEPPKSGYSKDFIEIWINVHNYDIEDPQFRQKVEEDNREKNAYTMRSFMPKESFYFFRSLLGANKAVEYASKMPKAGKIGVFGCSQGGYFTMFLAGLNSKVAAALAWEPAFMDCLRYKDGISMPLNYRHCKDWPGFDASMPYYDPVCLADRINCPINVVVGYADGTAFATTIHAVYNIIPSKHKTITVLPKQQHGIIGSNSNDYSRLMDEFRSELQK